MVGVVQLEEYRSGHRKGQGVVYFHRQELDQLLAVYSRRVAKGEWRDYALDHQVGCAIFSVFRHSFDRPLFSVVKRVRPGNRGTEYLLLAGPRQLDSNKHLSSLLKGVEKKLRVVS